MGGARDRTQSCWAQPHFLPRLLGRSRAGSTGRQNSGAVQREASGSQRKEGSHPIPAGWKDAEAHLLSSRLALSCVTLSEWPQSPLQLKPLTSPRLL